ncbi:hypothetical protein [Hyalangium rubrum]|uniref:Uncharacterized protein n=1 Tax=Hyalangium rubrum TaxID=3103134 RepID=A0ABU5HEL0_9BACT|nr:hypothetical protein [Hyalangium sp. s54d21]MDY7231904.1 hypothetical protein [Hyalangium sp. s54d21]
MTSSKLLALISTLAASRPFVPEEVNRLMATSLKPEVSVSNEYFTVYRARDTAKAPLQNVELRVPTSRSHRKDGLLLFEIAPSTCVTQEEARRSFGPSPELSFPTPHQPPDSPLYLSYSQPWGSLRLGFSRNDKACLVSVVLDADK